MQRISDCFENRLRRGGKALVGFLCAGDPDLEISESDIRKAIDAGLDILELGVPFSDPTADGPAIQEAGQRALSHGVTLEGIISMAARLRADYPELPIILFGYANPFFVMGYENTARKARDAGIDGLLVVDLPHEEAGEFKPVLRRCGLAMIQLIAPTTNNERAAAILREADGFVYVISVAGVTGTRENEALDCSSQIAGLRSITRLPIVVGFGISNGPQARRAATAADGVVVGSALVKAARDGRLVALVRELRSALDG